MELHKLTIHEAVTLLMDSEIKPREVVEALLKRIEDVDKMVNAFVTVTGEHALKGAEYIEKKNKMAKKKMLLAGIPMAIKDNMCTEHIRTTCSSKILENFIPPYESTVTRRLKEEGYILIGKTNLDEFAMGSSTENSAFGVTRNPWDLTTVPGGSSGGSAAAVAADMCLGALGSDTGGSIRQPASLCGVVGLKPTYGRVSRFGLIAFASSLDQIGPITKDVEDAALLLNIISGKDPLDSTSVDVEVPDFVATLKDDIKGMKIGVPIEFFKRGIDVEVEEAVLGAIKTLEDMGAIAVDISLPLIDYAIATYYILATSEASSNLARYDGVKYGLRVKGENLHEMYLNTRGSGFGAEVKRRIMLGTYALSSGYYEAYYKKAQQVRTLIIRDFASALEKVDIIATPTSPTPAFKIGEKIEDPLKMYMSDIFTLSVNLAGLPAISIPCGFTSEDLPIGFQLIGRHFDEKRILNAAYAYESVTNWHKKEPIDISEDKEI
ncbi:MAG: Asp-tRNA(Asn)/Glu-tRNA(Gln) amidotransferase subunit GatA [Nitrospirae bacterium]|nr:MAG: Asp-tRNA(Asn)/Glu-tRNA(Gln) amidotransferase subunit GatA [Nitrospirota bacterium]